MDQRVGSSSQDLLPDPVEGGHALTTQDRREVDFSNSIPGWGSDLDPAMRPGVPRDDAPEIGGESLYPDMPEQVPPPFPIHKSTEHARLTPVFGTSCPPHGLSGRMRDAAYKYSEGRFARWMTLMVADRVDVAEDVMSDLARLRVPNIVKEMGLKSEWRYNREGVIRKAAVAGIVALAMVAMLRARRSGSR